jgi:hypothetical protein
MLEEGGRLVMGGAVVIGKETYGMYLSEAKVVEFVEIARWVAGIGPIASQLEVAPSARDGVKTVKLSSLLV